MLCVFLNSKDITGLITSFNIELNSNEVLSKISLILVDKIKASISDVIKVEYKNALVEIFYIESIKVHYLKSLEILGSSIDYQDNLKIKAQRSFIDKPLNEIINLIALEASLKLNFNSSKKNIICSIEQDFSNAHLLTRLIKDYSLDLRISKNTINLIDKGSYFSSFKLENVKELTFFISEKNRFDRVEVIYKDEEGNTKTLSQGQGKKVLRLTRENIDINRALEIAQSEFNSHCKKIFNYELDLIFKDFSIYPLDRVSFMQHNILVKNISYSLSPNDKTTKITGVSI